MFDGSSIEGFVRIEESDMYLKPDLATFQVFPWSYAGSERVARIICDIANPDGTPFSGCPRSMLKRVIAMAADKTFVSVEKIVDTAGLTVDTPVQRVLLNRMMVTGVVETPNGAHFTNCVPDYERDEKFQKHYAKSVADPEAWAAFKERFLSGDEAAYQEAVKAFHAEQA